MHSYDQRTQYHDCLICFEPLQKQISMINLSAQFPLCLKCIKQFEIIDMKLDFHHYPLRILYHYNDFFKSLLYQYKGLYDIALKDAFLCLYHREFLNKFKNHIIVVAPSYQIDNEKRGFAPSQTIANTFSSHVFTGLYKKEGYKQSGLSFEQRKDVINKIGIQDGEFLTGKKVLIFDDVITSSSTMLACLKLVKSFHPQSIELLVLATKRSQDELKKTSGDEQDLISLFPRQ